MILLVIDIQKGIAVDELYAFDTFMDRNVRLIDAARKNHVEVVFVRHDAGPGSGLSAGDPGFEFADRVAPEKGEKSFVKTISSCFGNREFTKYMEQQEDKRLMIIGLQTNYCIDATVKSAFERGYQVIIPGEANSTFDNDYMTGETTYRYYNEEIWPDCFGECVTFDEAIAMLGE